MPISRSLLLATIRAWIGTPYHPQAALRGVGTDCSGLHQGIAADLGWQPAPPDQADMTILLAPDWAQHTTEEVFARAFLASGLVEPMPLDAYQPGDILLFGFGRHPASHAAWCTEGPPVPRLVHALQGRTVVEEPFSAAWQRRVRFVLHLREVMP